MKRFTFEHQDLLQLKHQQRKQAEFSVIKAAAEVARTQSEIDDLEQELATFASASQSPLQSAHVKHYEWYRCGVFCQRRMESARAILDRQRAGYERLRARLVEIETQVETLHALRLQKWQFHQAELQRERQLRSDEIAMRRWMTALASSNEEDLR